MQFRKVLALVGPNVWEWFSVLEALVDLEELKGASSDKLPGFNERLMNWLPTLVNRPAGSNECGRFCDALRRGIDLAHILQHVTLVLLARAGERAGEPAEFGKTCPTEEAGVFTVVIGYEEESLARACLDAARTLCLAAVYDRAYDVAAEIDRLCNLAYFACLGPSTRAIVAAALARGIPARRLNDESLVLLGHGARQRRILTAETDRTGAIAYKIAQDKELTRSLLGVVGVPVPEGRPVESAEDAWAAAQELGDAVVVKPRDANHARGVATNLTTRSQVLAAFEAALKEGSGVLVERYATGVDHRLLVVDGRLIAAARREAAQVVGDGSSTIAHLVEQINQDPRRGDGFLTPLGRVLLDAPALDVLSSQGYTPESVPSVGTPVLMRRQSHVITGGSAIDVTDQVHPTVAAHAVEAARVVGLDVAGIDMVATDASRPLEEQGGVVVEVNAGPGLGLHLPPWSDPPRPIGEAIVGLLFREGEDGRIPIVSVVGRGAATVVDRIARLLQSAGQVVGRASAGGLFVNQRPINRRDGSGADGAWTILRNPAVQVAVLETSRKRMREGGLGFDRCDVAVILDVERESKVERAVVKSLSPGGVVLLDADLADAADLATEAPRVIRLGREGRGQAVFARGGTIVLADEGKEQNRISLPGATGADLIAVAAAWALGLSPEKIDSAARVS